MGCLSWMGLDWDEKMMWCEGVLKSCWSKTGWVKNELCNVGER